MNNTEDFLSWAQVENVDHIDSPALLVYPDRVQNNINTLVSAVKSIHHLRPHVKTHKMAEIVNLQLEAGIYKYKCATIAEAEMLGQLKVKDVLLAYQPAGPKISRLRQLCDQYAGTTFSALVDNEASAQKISEAFVGSSLNVYLDIDVGMHRTGISPARAKQLFTIVKDLPSISPVGIHAYDGHIHKDDASERSEMVNKVDDMVSRLIRELQPESNTDLEVVVSGSPSFPYHASNQKYTCSPGTSLLWDWRYHNMCRDQDFNQAALVLTRVISKPGQEYICLDLGHKSIASEMPFPRVHFPQLPDASQVKHSEEHLVLNVSDNSHFEVGQAFYGIPVHICPTVALHHSANVIKENRLAGSWEVIARNRKITV